MLLNLDEVSSSNHVDLRRLYDKIESHVRGLKALGIESDSYGQLLTSVVIKKLPAGLRLILSSKISNEENWNMDALMETLFEEISARERAGNLSTQNRDRNFNRQNQNARTLYTGDNSRWSTDPICVYCKKKHDSSNCRTVTAIPSRKDILKKGGYCFICIKRNHIASRCRSNMRCQKCNGRHHVTICEFDSKKESSNGEQSSPRENQTPSPDQSAGEKAISGATSSRKVLLQTVQAIMQGDDGPVKVRILFDTGSQKSYITKRLADRLHLQVLGNHRMNIQVFGSDTDGQFEEYPIVESRLLDTNGTAMTFPLVVVPVICTGLSVYDLSNCKKMFPHLRGVHFSEFYYKDGSVDVDILIGADYYWSVMTGEVRRSNRGPVALGTKFGWTLSGPIGESETNQSSMVYFINEKTAKKSTYSNHDDDKHNNLLITQQRNCDCHQLETKLKNFWSIENLGLEENTDDPLFEEFKKSV
ncbi:uncharacterized protein LOC141910285 [Tubulanus polymorphus]|uniref:uncharacterized protein LOC141910285 n=1 Tax=Tubulanus polymorphus TaxID=672921 RepID=UPI003DA6BDFE